MTFYKLAMVGAYALLVHVAGMRFWLMGCLSRVELR